MITPDEREQLTKVQEEVYNFVKDQCPYIKIWDIDNIQLDGEFTRSELEFIVRRLDLLESRN